MLVQVVKEEIGRKGANMTTYLSLPGRCLVLMPGSDSEGISRKITGEERRNRLREIMNSFQIPEGIGWIVRTASVDITKTALSKDVTAEQGLSNHGMAFLQLETWVAAKKCWDEFPLDTIARSCVGHTQMVNAVAACSRHGGR